MLAGKIAKENHKLIAKNLAKDLKLDELNYVEMQNKLDEIGTVLEQTNSNNSPTLSNTAPQLKFVDKIFLYSSLILGSLITACSFIWGIL